MSHLEPEEMNRQQLLAHCYALETRLEAVGQAVGAGPIRNLRSAFRITRQEATILATLADGRLHSREALYGVLYAAKPDSEAGPQIVTVLISKLRRKLGDRVSILTIWGEGVRLEDPAPVRKAMGGHP